MQSLSIWASKSANSLIPQLNCDLGFSSVPRKRRRRKRQGVFVHLSKISRNSMNFHSNISSFHGFNLNSLYGFFTKYSNQDSVVIQFDSKVNSKPENSVRPPFSLALEQEAIDNQSPKKENDLEDEFLEKNRNRAFDSVSLNQIKENETSFERERHLKVGSFEKSKNGELGSVGLNEIKENVISFAEQTDKKCGNGSESDEEKCSVSANGEETRANGDANFPRVDVRALAWSLRDAKTALDVEAVLKGMDLLPLPVYSSMIRGFGRDQRLHSAIALVEWLEKKKDTDGSVAPNLYTYNSLLGAFKQCGQFGEVDRVLERMEEEGILPNVVTYNALMAIYLEQGKLNEALDVFTDVRSKGLPLSAITYSTALLAYRRMEDAKGALRFFVETREKYQKGEIGRDSNEDWDNEMVKLENFTIRICYQVMRRWLVMGDHRTTDVLKLLTDMDRAGVQLGRAEHEKLVWACTMERHFVVAKELYKRIREREMDISLSVCNHVIWLMGMAKKWWAALEVYEDLLDKGPEPNNLSYELIVSHFNILLTAARRRGIWRWGVRLLNKMQDKGLKPGSREWNAVLVACSKASETSAAVQIFRRMVENGEKPTILSYGALLSALEKGKLYDEAIRVWEHMDKVGVKPNLYAYTTMVSVYIGQGRLEEVDAVLNNMVSFGIEPTVVTFNAIISGFARSTMGGAAFEWFHRMKVRNITPNEITYEMLIEALAKDGKPRLAYDMYLAARDDGLTLSSRAYDLVVQLSQDYNVSIDTSLLGPRPLETKKIVKTRKVLKEFCNLADVPRSGKPFGREEIFRS